MIDKTQPRDWSEAIERLVTFHRTTYGMHQMRREALAILREFDGQNQQDLNDLLEKAMQFTMCDIDSADMVKYFVKKHKEKWREFLDNNDEQTEEPIEQVADDIDVVSKEQAAQEWWKLPEHRRLAHMDFDIALGIIPRTTNGTHVFFTSLNEGQIPDIMVTVQRIPPAREGI